MQWKANLAVDARYFEKVEARHDRYSPDGFDNVKGMLKWFCFFA